MSVSDPAHQNAGAQHLSYIDGCRGLAVLVVLLFHATIWAGFSSDLLTIIGRAGVDLFLVISGFCLTWPLLKNGTSATAKAFNVTDFFKKRIRRIVPPYYIALLFAIFASLMVSSFGGNSWWLQPFQNVFPSTSGSLALNLVSHLLLLHGFTPYHHSIDGAFWSLSLEWQFYILFPLLVIILRKRSIIHSFLTTAIVTIIFRVIVKIVDNSLVWNAYFNETACARWVEFGAGLLVAGIVASGQQRFSKLFWNLTSLTAIGVAVGISLTRGNFFLNPIIMGMAAAILVLAANRGDTILGIILRFRILEKIGKMSYSLYLLHGSVFLLFSIPLSRIQASFALRFFIYMGCAMAVAILAGYLGYRYMERPILRRARAISETSFNPQRLVIGKVDLQNVDGE